MEIFETNGLRMNVLVFPIEENIFDYVNPIKWRKPQKLDQPWCYL